MDSTQTSAAETEETLHRAWTLQLHREFQEVTSYYDVDLERPWIELMDSRTHYGTYDPLTRTIRISIHAIREFSWDVVIEILKHEMAHALVASERKGHEEPHGPYFQLACQRLGVAPWARSSTIEIDPATTMQEHRKLDPDQERLLRKVEKLLSLAQSQETHEASLAMERARELCSRYQLENLREGQKNTYTYVVICHGKKIIPTHQSMIAGILCTHFYVDCVSRSQYDPKQNAKFKVIEILGTRENVQMAEYVYWFLWNQLPLLWRQHGKSQKKGRSSARSFYIGVLNGFHEKLAAQNRELETKAREWGLVVQDPKHRLLQSRKRDELRRFIEERYPQTSRRSGSQQGVDYDQYVSGHAQGRTLNLHRGLTHGSSGDIHLLQDGKD